MTRSAGLIKAMDWAELVADDFPKATEFAIRGGFDALDVAGALMIAFSREYAGALMDRAARRRMDRSMVKLMSVLPARDITRPFQRYAV